jgi:hypothetical protein
VRPAARNPRQPRDAASDYREKSAYEISRLSKEMKEQGFPAPLGDPTSGIMLVLEQPVGPRPLEALKRSLDAVGLPEAYVTYESTGLLAREILATQPQVLVAIGPGAARDIDAVDYPLVKQPFSDAKPGFWFPWTKGTAGLALPAIAPALGDDATKLRFWRTFLSLRALSQERKTES